jgi:hypothetical protein
MLLYSLLHWLDKCLKSVTAFQFLEVYAFLLPATVNRFAENFLNSVLLIYLKVSTNSE